MNIAYYTGTLTIREISPEEAGQRREAVGPGVHPRRRSRWPAPRQLQEPEGGRAVRPTHDDLSGLAQAMPFLRRAVLPRSVRYNRTHVIPLTFLLRAQDHGSHPERSAGACRCLDESDRHVQTGIGCVPRVQDRQGDAESGSCRVQQPERIRYARPADGDLPLLSESLGRKGQPVRGPGVREHPERPGR